MLSSAFVSSSFAETLFAASSLAFQPPSGYLWQSLSATYIDILKRAAPGEKPRLSKANCIHLIWKKRNIKHKGKRPCLRPLFRRSSPHLALQKRFQIHFADSPFTANLQRRYELLRDHLSNLLFSGFQQHGSLGYGQQFGHAHGSSFLLAVKPFSAL